MGDRLKKYFIGAAAGALISAAPIAAVNAFPEQLGESIRSIEGAEAAAFVFYGMFTGFLTTRFALAAKDIMQIIKCHKSIGEAHARIDAADQEDLKRKFERMRNRRGKPEYHNPIYMKKEGDTYVREGTEGEKTL